MPRELYLRFITLPLNAALLIDAVRRFAPADLLAEYEQLRERLKTARPVPDREAAMAHQQAWEILVRNLVDKLRKGSLVGYARSSDRDPWRVLEVGAWHENVRIRVYESSIVDVLGNVFSVCVGPPLQLSDVAPSKTEDVDQPQSVKRCARVIELGLDHDAERVTLVGIGELGRGDYRLINGLRELQLEDKPRSERRFFPSLVIAE